MSESSRIIEINGIKIDVDLSTAKIVDTYRVGQPVKLLKKRYSDTWESHPAVIIGFTPYAKRPAIELLYMDGSELKFETFYEGVESEIAPFNEYEFKFSKADIVNRLNRKITENENELQELQSKKQAFLDNFGTLMEASAQEVA